MLKIKNIAIFVAAIIVLVLIYVFFIKKDSEPTGLVSTSPIGVTTSTTATTTTDDTAMTRDFLALLLSVKSIRLDDTIFSDPAFSTLHDSSIVLTPDGTEGRSNPFAPLGVDASTAPSGGIPIIQTTPTVPNSSVTTPKP